MGDGLRVDAGHLAQRRLRQAEARLAKVAELGAGPLAGFPCQRQAYGPSTSLKETPRPYGVSCKVAVGQPNAFQPPSSQRYVASLLVRIDCRHDDQAATSSPAAFLRLPLRAFAGTAGAACSLTPSA